MTKEFNEYLKSHISKKGEAFTHTRIGDKDMRIFGGSYYFHNEEDFLFQYYNNVFINNKIEYITEKQLTGYAPLLLDIDMRYRPEITTRQHTYEHVVDLMMLISNKILKIYNVENNFEYEVFILEKDDVNVLENKTKDGLHLIFGIRTEKPSHVMIRDAIMYELKELWEDLPLTNSAEDLVDEGIIKGHTNWQMYGSTKPNNEPYKLKYHFSLKWSQEKDDYDITSWDIDNFDIRNNLYKLSARNQSFPILEVNEKHKERYIKLKQKEVIKKPIIPIEPIIDDYNLKLVNLINDETLGKREDWLKIIFAMKRERYDEAFAKDTSLRATGNFTPLTDEVWETTWNSEDGRENGLSLGTIKFYAKRDNPLGYYNLKLQSKEIYPSDRIEICSCVTEKYLAEVFDYISKDIIYIKNDDNFYTWINGRWNKDDKKYGNYARQLISKTLYNYFNNINIILCKIRGLVFGDENLIEKNRKYIQKVGDVMAYLGKTTWLNNIWTELKSIIISKTGEIEFDCFNNYIAFNNLKFNFTTSQFSKIERDDYLSMSCGFNYENPKEDQITVIDNLFKQIHPNEEIRKCYLSIMYNALIGGIKRKFIIANGSGGNGKVLLNELLKELLGDYAYEGNTTVLTEKLKGGANPEIANMNKKRLVLWKEAGADEKLRLDTIKKITDNAEINARGLYSSVTTTKLEATNIMEVNARLKFDTNKISDGESRRFIDVLFESTFTDDPTILKDPTRINVYPCDEKFKSTQFKKSHRCALFKYIIDNAEKDIYIPNIVNKRTAEYIDSNDEFYAWFEENYELTTNQEDIVKIKNVFEKYKCSDIYINLYKKERPTLSRFTNDIITHKYLRSKYKEVLQITNKDSSLYIKYKQVKMRNVLQGVKPLANDCLINDTDED